MTKRTFKRIVLLLTFITSCAFANQNLNAVVAVVNNQIITGVELNNAIAAAKQQLAASATPNAINDAQLRKMVLNQLIDEKLQLEIAKNAKLTVTDAQVSQAIAHIAQANGVSVSQLKSKLAQTGMSYADYRKMIHKQILIHEVEQKAVGEKVGPITHADLQKARSLYQAQVGAQTQYHVIDIVLPTQQQAQKIMMQLKQGASIKKVAPKQTTDLGWQTQNTLPSLFLNQLSSMKPGDTAGPIQAPNGYHVIQLVGLQGQPGKPNESQLQNMAYQLQLQQAVKVWIKSLRQSAYIKVNE